MLGIPSIEAYGKAEIEKVEAKLCALDLNHDGLPDVAEAKKLFSEGVAELKVLEAKVTPAEIAAALNVLFPGKYSEAEIVKAEASGAKIMNAFTLLASVVKSAGLVV